MTTAALILLGFCLSRAWTLHLRTFRIYEASGRLHPDKLPESTRDTIAACFWEAMLWKLLAVWAGWLWWTA